MKIAYPGFYILDINGKDIVHFAKAVEISHPIIDGKVCSGTHAALETGKGKKYTADVKSSDTNGDNTAQCSGLANSAAEATHKFLSKFVSLTKIGEGRNWPTGQAAGTTANAITMGAPNSNATAVAKDLVKELTPEEKNIVAGLLAKTIEGGEVVEIRAVSSTSVMVNACYDLLSEGLGVVPYACVGLGGNFVGVVDGHITPKLAYRSITNVISTKPHVEYQLYISRTSIVASHLDVRPT